MSELLRRIAQAQDRRPWPFLLGGLLLAAGSVPWVLGLTLDGDFEALLPDHARSVQDLRTIRRRFDQSATLTVAVRGGGRGGDGDAARHRFVEDLVPKLRALDGVVGVDWNLSPFIDFVEEHRALYADLDDLERFRDDLEERINFEKSRRSPFFLDLGVEPPPTVDEIVDRLEANAEEARQELDRFPDGFFDHPERPVTLIFLRVGFPGSEAERVDRLWDAVQREAEALGPDGYVEGLAIEGGGDLLDVRKEHGALLSAAVAASALTISLVLLALVAYFRRFRAIPLLAFGLTPPILLTFAFAELTVGSLNASSAFLNSIVIGNGINPNLIFLARFFEARRREADGAPALEVAHLGTWRGTLTASGAAALAYASLIVTDYRGFRDFGIIGGFGMVACWLGAYLFLPALVVAFERLRPLRFAQDAGGGHRSTLPRWFASMAVGRPRGVLAGAGLISAITLGLVVWAVAQDPMEYDFRNLQAARDDDSMVDRVNRLVGEVVDETTSGSALAVLMPTPEDARQVQDQMQEARESREESAGPAAYGAVRSMFDFLPEEQEDKVPTLEEIRALLLDARRFAEPDVRERIDQELPPEEIEPVQPGELPGAVLRPFLEKDGTRGRLLYVEHHPEANGWDGKTMFAWADAARSVRAPSDGSAPPVAGNAVTFGDVMAAILVDAPKAIGVAFLATVLLVLGTFREGRHRWLTLGALLTGILWMAGLMATLQIKLNFLNLVAFPITFGNGVDYGVNVMRRYADEREERGPDPGAVRAAVEGTGGAVALCSLTTIIGYLSLYTSPVQALNSFGEAMAISEVTCLAAALLILPAALELLDRRGRRKAGGARGR